MSGPSNDNKGSAWEHAIENGFHKYGQFAAHRAGFCVTFSVLLTMLFGMQMGKAVTEERPQEQWVASGSPSLEHFAYVGKTWPSQARFNMYMATCQGANVEDGIPSDCNVLSSDFLSVFQQRQEAIKEIVLDGDAIAKHYDDGTGVTDKYKGKWSFDGRDGTQAKCFKWGPVCAELDILDAFGPPPCQWGGDMTTANPADMTDSQVLQEVEDWNSLDRSAGGQCAPFDLAAVLGKTKEEQGEYKKAGMTFGWSQLAADTVVIGGRESDYLAMEFEAEALCALGIEPTPFNATHMTRNQEKCTQDDDVYFTAMYMRSMSDSFGVAIRGDLPMMGASYVLMAVYLFVMLSRRDGVHAMIGMSVVALVAVLFSYACGFGFCALIGVKNGALNNTVLFLLLGLGVDDAFVLSSEFARETKLHPERSIDERIANTAKHGGVSIFITSLTDVLAFLIGSMTKLPALSWFCQYCGWCIAFCFVFQLTLYLPCLKLNAMRAEKGFLCGCGEGKCGSREGNVRADCLCCLQAPARPFTGPLTGCCGLFCKLGGPCGMCGKQDILESLLFGFGKIILSPKGRILSLVLWVVLTVVGIAGAALIEKDFKIQWFIPNDTYPYEFLTWNEDYFKQGEPFSVYTKQFDYFEKQEDLEKLNTFLQDASYIDDREDVKDWHNAFRTAAAAAGTALSSSAVFHTELHKWLWTGDGASHRSNVRWIDSECNEKSPAECAACDCTALEATRISAVLHLDELKTGGDSYLTMEKLRKGVVDIMGADAFAYSMSFLYWEEMGLIDTELMQNLIICGCVILVIICLLIPRAPIALMCSLSVITAIVDVVGYCHWIGITVSGVSTIYLLIAVGLAVDYSAHIAHFFKDATGTAEERAHEALGRIGPCVFHAVMTMFLACLTLSGSASFIFRTLFKIFSLTVLFGGSYGVWFLPVLLATFGGSNGEKMAEEKPQAEMADGAGA